MRTYRWLGVLFVVAPLLALGKGGDILEGHWIVILEDPPLVRFEGGEVLEPRSDGSMTRKALAPTSPSVTGERRLDVFSSAARSYSAHLADRQADTLRQASGLLQRELSPTHVYRNVANGFSAAMTTAEANELATLPGVVAVEPVLLYDMLLDAGPEWIRATPQAQQQAGLTPVRGESIVIGVIDSGIHWGHPYFSDQFAPDYVYSNPYPDYLGECSDISVDCNDKLVGVYDFTDEGGNGRDISGHGSHVAAIAAGNPLTWQLTLPTGTSSLPTAGVANRSHIVSYKVCYSEDAEDEELAGRCGGNAMLAALDQAVEDGVDLVNFSIGGTPRNPWATIGSSHTSLEEKFLNVREAGIIPVAAAGNDGPAPGSVTSAGNAPWVIGVGNVSHSRRFTNRLTNLAGGDTTLDDLPGAGSTAGTGMLPIVHARDYGNALCGEGSAQLAGSCGQLDGSSNPFPPGTFDGKIVVCDRGEYGRLEKGHNVMQAGAAGMILANTSQWGESIITDQHCLPATHVGAADGDRLRTWLDSGSSHQGRLSGEVRDLDQEFGNWVSLGSSRGPERFAPAVMKPNLVAPGTDILSAGDGDDAAAFATGTSMASPHVAGAAALLLSRNPDWSVNMVQSALETTTRVDNIRSHTGERATVADRGAGLVDVAAAMKAGLYLNVTPSQFRAAGSSSGNPGNLNLAGMVDVNCIFECTFTRMVTAMESGSWTVSGEGEVQLTVSPEEFSLTAGQSQMLEITARVDSPETVGGWADGRVVLSPSAGSLSTQYLTVGVVASGGILPEVIELEVDSNRGRREIGFEDVVDLPEATFRASPLVRPDTEQISLPQDSDPSDPFDGSSGTRTFWLDVPEDTLMLYAEVFGSSAPDIDLYVGRDDYGTGTPEAAGVRCEGTSPDELELCMIERPEPGQWWVLVQNWQGSGSADTVDLRMAVLVDEPDPSLVLTGPGHHERGPLDLDLVWDQPGMARDEMWMGAISLGTDPSRPGNAGIVPVRLTRTAQAGVEQMALFPDHPETVTVAPGAVYDLLYVDVPDGVGALNVKLVGAGLEASLGYRGFDQVAGYEPGTPPAPQNQIMQGSVSESGLELTVPSDQLSPGRWYVVLDNPGSSERQVEITVGFEEVQPDQGQFGIWSPSQRSTSSGFSWQRAGSTASIIWYTFGEDGLPVFYTASGGLPDDGVHWTGKLYRVTSNQQRQIPIQIGTVGLTFLADDDMMFSWRLNGEHGSERMGVTARPACQMVDGEAMSFSGDWYVPGVRKGGTTVVIGTQGRGVLRYYFDTDHMPRWVLGGNSLDSTPTPGSLHLEAIHLEGACPWCDAAQSTTDVVGTYRMDFHHETRGNETVEFVSPAPLSQDFVDDSEVSKLSSRIPCED